MPENQFRFTVDNMEAKDYRGGLVFNPCTYAC